MTSSPRILDPGPDLRVLVDALDLTNCEDEPIRVPGSIQPHGVLLTMADASSPIRQVSENVRALTGLSPDEVLGSTIDTIFTAGTVSRVTAAMKKAHPQLAATGIQQQIRVRVRLALALGTAQPVDLDGLLHRSGPDWVLEVEPYTAAISVENTYHEVRSVVTALGRTMDAAAMYEITVRQIRALTGFDRVMLYRFDRDWNGEVCAEDKREDLESFRGLHYPAGDIPAQARALYTVNWLRFIHDVDAVSASLVPVLQPSTGQPLDLSFASLRSVSPIHCEYLRNMGVTASMSVSIVIDGQLSGLIACHHYSGPHVPPPAVRATCEFLAQTLSLLVAAREQVARTDREGLTRQVLAHLAAGTGGSHRPLATSLIDHAPALLQVMGAAGTAWTLDGVTRTWGLVPDHADVSHVREWGRLHADDDGLASTEALGRSDGPVLGLAERASGVIVLVISDDQDVVFFRPESAQTIDWGGNPHLKNLVTDADGTARLSPRGSFKLWRENVLGRSLPWEPQQLEAGRALRLHLVEHMLRHARDLAGVAETLARSLLPERLPQPAGWRLDADSRPAATGVGGDWYDAFVVPSGQLMLVVGDVAGHGLHAATTMAHLRNALRAYAFEDPSPPRLLARLDRLASAQTDDVLTTIVVALLDPATGHLQVASAGHPAPLVQRQDGSTDYLSLDARPPLGLGYQSRDADEGTVTLTMLTGEALVLFSDGVIERRGESIERGLGRLRRLLQTDLGQTGALSAFISAAQAPVNEDDTTLMLLVRDGDGL